MLWLIPRPMTAVAGSGIPIFLLGYLTCVLRGSVVKERELPMSTYINTLSLFSRNVRLFLTATAINGFAFFGIYNLLLNLYLLRLGYGPQFIGLVNAVGPLAFGIGSIPAGIISQRWGSRRTLIASYSIVLVTFTLLPYAEFVGAAWQQLWIATNYALAWLAATLFAVNTAPFLMASTTNSERNHAFAVHAAIGPVAGFLGNLVGGVLPGLFAGALALSLETPSAYRLSLWFAASLYLVAVWAMYRAHEAYAAHAKTHVVSFAPPPYAIIFLLAAVGFLRTGGEWVMRVFFNVYMDTALQAPVALIGGVSALSQLMGLAALLAPMVMLRWDKFHLSLFGMVIMTCSFLPLLLIGNVYAVAISYMVLIAAFALTMPAFSVLNQESVDVQWRTRLSGATNMAFGAGISAVAIGGGYVLTYFDFRALFAAAAGLLLAAALLFWAAFNRAAGKV
jgi:predicted MFS family arabinose efflux permease